MVITYRNTIALFILFASFFYACAMEQSSLTNEQKRIAFAVVAGDVILVDNLLKDIDDPNFPVFYGPDGFKYNLLHFAVFKHLDLIALAVYKNESFTSDIIEQLTFLNQVSEFKKPDLNMIDTLLNSDKLTPATIKNVEDTIEKYIQRTPEDEGNPEDKKNMNEVLSKLNTEKSEQLSTLWHTIYSEFFQNVTKTAVGLSLLAGVVAMLYAYKYEIGSLMPQEDK